MARVLLVGCGGRGLALAAELREAGHAVRGTSRSAERRAAMRQAGVDPVAADPDRVGTLVSALPGVAVVCHLLGSASGPPEAIRALHAERLEMLLVKLVDTGVRGLLYEAEGSAGETVLADGARRVSEHCERSRIPFVLSGAVGCDEGSVGRAAAAIEGLLSGAQ